ncbi:MAG TPA: type II secretion system F family protein [Candidatus Paceibacterota bacterium]
MALFTYTALDQEGSARKGTIDAATIDLAITALQRRGLVISNIEGEKLAGGFLKNITIFSRITNADVVMLSRQITTLFEAQVSALRAFRLLATEARTPRLSGVLTAVAEDIQSGTSISSALSKHPAVFSAFYVNMVRAGEEAGKLDETFGFLADYLDRNYELTQKARNALVYPSFLMITFVVVMSLMMTVVIPQLSGMLTELGQSVPIYTRIVITLSELLSQYIWLLLTFLVVGGVVMYRYTRTGSGREMFSRARMQIPHVGGIYKRLFLSRVADNLATMLKSGIQMLRGLEVTGSVVGDAVYEKILMAVASDVKSGLPVSEAFRKHPEVPGIIIAMMHVGEETGNMSHILETMARFYRREVNNAIDTLVGLIEPFMIVVLAVGVAILLASVLVPIYNIAAGL